MTLVKVSDESGCLRTRCDSTGLRIYLGIVEYVSHSPLRVPCDGSKRVRLRDDDLELRGDEPPVPSVLFAAAFVAERPDPNRRVVAITEHHVGGVYSGESPGSGIIAFTDGILPRLRQTHQGNNVNLKDSPWRYCGSATSGPGGSMAPSAVTRPEIPAARASATFRSTSARGSVTK